MKITVFGTGGWGMALALLLNDNGHDVSMWTFFEKERDEILATRANEKLLPGIKIPENIVITCDMNIAKDCEIVVIAVPSFAVHSTAEKLSKIIDDKTIIVDVAKGLDRENGYCRFSQSIEQATNGKNKVVALTGPTHAEEVARKMPSTILAASTDKSAAIKVQRAFMNNNYFRVYTSDDVIGAELGGALKNIIALAAGICDGMGLGDNSKAGLMTRGLTEIARLGVKLGANAQTFAGLSGIGDLIVTCTSMHSRNRRAGILIGKGTPTQDALKEIGAVVEGYYATAAAYELAKLQNVEMPIVQGMYAILYQNVSPQDAMMSLMTRTAKDEREIVWIEE